MKLGWSKKGEPQLFGSDFHAPYQHPDALTFLQYIRQKYNCRKELIIPGDLFDFHAMSRHPTEPDALNAKDEYEKALKFVARLVKVFPAGVLVLGNHDLIPQKQLQEFGINECVLKKWHDLYGLPSTWRIEPLRYKCKEYDTLVEHGTNSSGPSAAINKAIIEGSSYVMGHNHSDAGVLYAANHQELKFGMNTGCLCDNTAVALRYAKYAKRRGVVGCGLVYSANHAEFIPMELGSRIWKW